MKRAVVLLSGGLDSAVTLAIARAEGFELYALSFQYGQRHRIEIDSARRVAASLGARAHRVAQIDLRIFGGSALTDEIAVPQGRSVDEMSEGIPVTYVPARNTIFLSYALAWAEVLNRTDIFIGVNAVDYSGYPDCRQEFLRAFEDLAVLATRAGLTARVLKSAPHSFIFRKRISSAKAPTWASISHSRTVATIHHPMVAACGRCDSCQLRLKGFQEAGLVDPIRYAVK